jgi:hypothetical protein
MKGLMTTIKKIPILGNLVFNIFLRIKRIPRFTTSGRYWEERYRLGGNSGTGSYDLLAEYKAKIINDFINEKGIMSVIEFGSGDGNQLKYFNCKSYIGFDVSHTAISKCREMYSQDPTKKFEVMESYNKEKADLVLSLDVIYHLVEDDVYSDYMYKLFSSSNKYVIIYSSNDDEHQNNNKVAHIRHRKFTNWIEKNAPEFKLIRHIPNKYPFNGNGINTSYADFYFFQFGET